ncbi:MAG: imelysin family protein [Pseudomonadota bacterium]
MQRLSLLSAAVIAVATPAAALDADIERVMANHIQPAFATLAADARMTADAVDALCGAPSAAALDAAQAAFGVSLNAFAAASVFDFGPARAEDRFARLLFWPDRGGRGLRNVQGLIAAEDPALDVAALRAKRVDVQGFPALEFTLFGTGSETLATAEGAGRCGFAQSVSGAIAVTADELRAEWTAPDAYPAVFTAPYAEDGVFRDAGEATREVLRVAGQIYEGVGKLHLAPALGEGPDVAKPKRAAFWRSGLTFAFLDAQMAAAIAVFGPDGLGPALSEGDGAAAVRGLALETRQARGALPDAPTDVLAAFADADTHGRLAYAQTPANGAAKVINPRIASALGLIVGFNSLDGD